MLEVAGRGTVVEMQASWQASISGPLKEPFSAKARSSSRPRTI